MRLSLFFGASTPASTQNSSHSASRESSVGMEGLTLNELGLDLDSLARFYAPAEDEFIAKRPVSKHQPLARSSNSSGNQNEGKEKAPKKPSRRAFSLDSAALRPKLQQDPVKANRGKKRVQSFPLEVKNFARSISGPGQYGLTEAAAIVNTVMKHKLPPGCKVTSHNVSNWRKRPEKQKPSAE